jgi:Holliday junction resolvase
LTQYQRGYRFELLVKKKWEDRGYWVIRAAGSHGKADLVALIHDGDQCLVYLVQCKLKGVISLQDREELAKLANDLHCTAVLAYKNKDNVYKEEWLS